MPLRRTSCYAQYLNQSSDGFMFTFVVFLRHFRMSNGKDNKFIKSPSNANTILKYFGSSLIGQSKTAIPRQRISKQKKTPPNNFYLERLRKKQHDEQIQTSENEDNGSQDITLLEVTDEFGIDDDNNHSDYVKCSNIECIEKVNYFVFHLRGIQFPQFTRQYVANFSDIAVQFSSFNFH